MSTKPQNKSFLLRLLIALFCAYMLVSLGTLAFELSQNKEALAELKEETKQTSLRIEEKENLLKNSTKEELIERAARESLGFVYPNEQVFVDIN